MNSVLKPRRLEPGQTVGITAPAGCIEEDAVVWAAIETIRSLGFQVKPGATLFRRHGYFAGTDAERAADLNALFADPTVDGIIALRGGYGCSRLLPYLDYDLIPRQPKVLMGYSDVTALLNGIHARTGLVTFHGPIADQLLHAVHPGRVSEGGYGGRVRIVLGAAPPFAAEPGRVERENLATVLAPGKAAARSSAAT